jgi:hypothetical protein
MDLTIGILSGIIIGFILAKAFPKAEHTKAGDSTDGYSGNTGAGEVPKDLKK